MIAPTKVQARSEIDANEDLDDISELYRMES